MSVAFVSHFKILGNDPMIVSFIFQLNWATGCSDIGLNIIIGVSMRVFLEKINILIGRMSKADCPLLCRWASSNLLKAKREQNTD